MHGGAGAYICGEETALLDSLEGKRGQPRLKPPFPATNGLYDAPTVVNNVGTLASVPYIVLGGADWFKPMGPEGSPGPCIYSLSGRIANPGQYEAPMGTTLRELIEMAGGMSRGKALKFWTPGGSSTPLLTAEHLDVPLDFDSVVKAGSMNGTSAVMIFDEDDCVVRAVKKWIGVLPSTSRAASARRAARAPTGTSASTSGSSTARAPRRTSTRCSTCPTTSSAARSARSATARPARSSSSIKYFRDEYLAHLENHGCPFPEPALSQERTDHDHRATLASEP